MKSREEIENKIKEYNEQLDDLKESMFYKPMKQLRGVQIELLEWVLSD